MPKIPLEQRKVEAVASSLNSYFTKQGLSNRLSVEEFDKLGVSFAGVNFSDDEKMTIVYAYNKGRETGDYSQYMDLISYKADLSQKFDAMDKACRDAKIPVKKDSENGKGDGFEPFTFNKAIEKMQSKSFFRDNYGKTVAEEIASGNITSQNLYKILGTANYQMQEIASAEKDFELLKIAQTRFFDGSVAKAETEMRSDVLGIFQKIGADVNAMKSTMNFGMTENPDADKLRSEPDLSKINFEEDMTIASAKSVKLALKQTESAILAGAIGDSMNNPNPESWRLNSYNSGMTANEKELFDKVVLNDGEDYSALVAKVQNYSAEIGAIFSLIDPTKTNEYYMKGVNAGAMYTLKNEFLKACIKEGAFGCENDEERYAAYTRAALADNVNNLFRDAPLRKVVKDGKESVELISGYKKESFLVDNEGNPYPIDIKDSVTKGNVGEKIAYLRSNEEFYKQHKEVRYTDLNEKNFKISKGNILAKQFEIQFDALHTQSLKTRQSDLKQKSLADMNKKTEDSSAPSFYKDLQYYKEQVNQARSDYARMGIKFLTRQEMAERVALFKSVSSMPSLTASTQENSSTPVEDSTASNTKTSDDQAQGVGNNTQGDQSGEAQDAQNNGANGTNTQGDNMIAEFVKQNGFLPKDATLADFLNADAMRRQSSQAQGVGNNTQGDQSGEAQDQEQGLEE